MNPILITEELLAFIPALLRGFQAANAAHAAGKSLLAIIQATIDAMATPVTTP